MIRLFLSGRSFSSIGFYEGCRLGTSLPDGNAAAHTAEPASFKKLRRDAIPDKSTFVSRKSQDFATPPAGASYS